MRSPWSGNEWCAERKDAYLWDSAESARIWREANARSGTVMRITKGRDPVEIRVSDVIYSGMSIDIIPKEETREALKDRVEWFRKRLIAAGRNVGIQIEEGAFDAELSHIADTIYTNYKDANIEVARKNDRIKALEATVAQRNQQLDDVEAGRRKMRDERDQAVALGKRVCHSVGCKYDLDQTYVCDGCKAVCCYCNGADDAHSELCDNCANLAVTNDLVATLRKLLIEAGRNAGALLSDDVSDSFLQHIPHEVAGRIAKLEKQSDGILADWREYEAEVKPMENIRLSLRTLALPGEDFGTTFNRLLRQRDEAMDKVQKMLRYVRDLA